MKSRLRILHLEDSPLDSELIEATLAGAEIDCELVRVETREAFVTALAENGFDLVLADYALPSFDGLTALTLAHERHPEVPFIFVSGSLGEELAVETLTSGATDYVLKQRLSRLAPAVVRAVRAAEERAEKRKVDEALRRSEEQVRSITESTNEWIWSIDLQMRCTYNNSAVERILGYTLEEMMDQNLPSLMHPEDRKKVDDLLPGLMAAKKGWNGLVVRWRTKQGAYRYLESNAVPMLDEAGELVGYQGADRDITERIQLEEQFRQSQKMEAIGQLAGGISHDFNNLLTGMMGYTQLLLAQSDPDSDVGRDLAEINALAERAAALTRQLLAFSRKQTLQPAVVNINQLVENLSKLLGRLIGNQIALRFEAGAELGSILADSGQLEQVLVNLVVNARDAMPQGGTLTIETANVVLDSNFVARHLGAEVGPHVMLAVSDTGCGMDEETRRRIFEPFFTTKEVGKGTGLGLSTVYGIVKQHHGSIWVYSEPGVGTSFKVYLPQVESGVQQVQAQRTYQREHSGSETILVVDDEAPVRHLAQRALEAQGYKVLTAKSATEAEQQFRRSEGAIDLLISDMVMAGGNGLEVYRQLAPLAPGLKVLFMSGFTDLAAFQADRFTRELPFLQKPFTLDSLVRKVREVLESGSEPFEEEDFGT